MFDNLSISIQKGETDIEYIDIKAGGIPENLTRLIHNYIAEGLLRSLSASYDGELWLMDVSMENDDASVNIIDNINILNYTYLNPQYLDGLKKIDGYEVEGNIFIVDDEDDVSINGTKNTEAMQIVEIMGYECPKIHVCSNKEVLLEIIVCFLENGHPLKSENWLRS